MHWYPVHHFTYNLLLNSPSDYVYRSKIFQLAELPPQSVNIQNFPDFFRFQNEAGMLKMEPLI